MDSSGEGRPSVAGARGQVARGLVFSLGQIVVEHRKGAARETRVSEERETECFIMGDERMRCAATRIRA